MKRAIPFGFTLLLLVCILISIDSFSQDDYSSLIKAGGFLNFNDPSGFSGFSINLEHERTFKRNMSFTHGPRLDYEWAKRYIIVNPSYVKYFSGIENLIIGYELKFYPFYFKSQKPYQGILIGIDPCYFTPINKRYKYGPGLGSLIGYQYVFKNKISLGFEASMIYMQNVNNYAGKANPQDRYFYFLANVKIGIKLK